MKLCSFIKEQVVQGYIFKIVNYFKNRVYNNNKLDYGLKCIYIQKDFTVDRLFKLIFTAYNDATQKDKNERFLRISGLRILLRVVRESVFHLFILQIFMKCLLGARHYVDSWDTMLER